MNTQMNTLEKYSDEDLLNALIDTAHRVSNPSENSFLSDIRAVLAERLAKRATDSRYAVAVANCPRCACIFDVALPAKSR
jgi:hypothetical protein